MLQQYISGLKGHQALSPGHRPGDKCSGICTLKGQKLSVVSAFALTGRGFHDVHKTNVKLNSNLTIHPLLWPHKETNVKLNSNLSIPPLLWPR